MRQRLHIARALLAEPRVVLLDEPAAGLDPQAARELRALVRDLATSGVAVLLTTHYMVEAEQLAHRLAVIDQGELIAEGSVADVADAAGVTTVFSWQTPALQTDDLERVRKVAGVQTTLSSARHGVTTVDVLTNGDPQASQTVRDMIQQAGGKGSLVIERPATLEEAYLALIQRPQAQPR